MVEMDWDADGFIESKKYGFISAVHDYNGVAVAFRDGKVYTHVDEDGTIGFADLVKTIKRATKENDTDYPDYYEDYACIFDGKDFFDSTMDNIGISEFKDDITARLNDLSGYWGITEVESLC